MEKIYFVTDCLSHQWLSYILSEFQRINGCQAEIEIISCQNQAHCDSQNIIYYTHANQLQPSIYNCQQMAPTGEIKYLDDSLFVLESSYQEKASTTISYDLLWNAFVFLSRLEEFQLSKKNKTTHGNCFFHPRKDKQSFQIPIVNHLFDRLELFIKDNFPNVFFKTQQKPVLDFSHDLDYINRNFPLFVKETIINAINCGRSLFNISDLKYSFKQQCQHIFTKNSFCNIKDLINMEKDYQVKSIFYVYAQTHKQNLWSWFSDPHYQIKKSPELQKQIQQLVKDGCELGLHGSFASTRNSEILQKEKLLLEQTIEQPVKRVRQHWLQYDEQKTPAIHNSLFEIDSTLGWNDFIGFRSGIASQYHVYDHTTQKKLELLEIPQLVMDLAIFHDVRSVQQIKIKQCKQILNNILKHKSIHVSISWHPHSHAICPESLNFYQDILQWYQSVR